MAVRDNLLTASSSSGPTGNASQDISDFLVGESNYPFYVSPGESIKTGDFVRAVEKEAYVASSIYSELQTMGTSVNDNSQFKNTIRAEVLKSNDIKDTILVATSANIDGKYQVRLFLTGRTKNTLTIDAPKGNTISVNSVTPIRFSNMKKIGDDRLAFAYMGFDAGGNRIIQAVVVGSDGDSPTYGRVTISNSQSKISTAVTIVDDNTNESYFWVITDEKGYHCRSIGSTVSPSCSLESSDEGMKFTTEENTTIVSTFIDRNKNVIFMNKVGNGNAIRDRYDISDGISVDKFSVSSAGSNNDIIPSGAATMSGICNGDKKFDVVNFASDSEDSRYIYVTESPITYGDLIFTLVFTNSIDGVQIMTKCVYRTGLRSIETLYLLPSVKENSAVVVFSDNANGKNSVAYTLQWNGEVTEDAIKLEVLKDTKYSFGKDVYIPNMTMINTSVTEDKYVMFSNVNNALVSTVLDYNNDKNKSTFVEKSNYLKEEVNTTILTGQEETIKYISPAIYGWYRNSIGYKGEARPVTNIASYSDYFPEVVNFNNGGRIAEIGLVVENTKRLARVQFMRLSYGRITANFEVNTTMGMEIDGDIDPSTFYSASTYLEKYKRLVVYTSYSGSAVSRVHVYTNNGSSYGYCHGDIYNYNTTANFHKMLPISNNSVLVVGDTHITGINVGESANDISYYSTEMENIPSGSTILDAAILYRNESNSIIHVGILYSNKASGYTDFVVYKMNGQNDATTMVFNASSTNNIIGFPYSASGLIIPLQNTFPELDDANYRALLVYTKGARLVYFKNGSFQNANNIAFSLPMLNSNIHNHYMWTASNTYRIFGANRYNQYSSATDKDAFTYIDLALLSDKLTVVQGHTGTYKVPVSESKTDIQLTCSNIYCAGIIGDLMLWQIINNSNYEYYALYVSMLGTEADNPAYELDYEESYEIPYLTEESVVVTDINDSSIGISLSDGEGGDQVEIATNGYGSQDTDTLYRKYSAVLNEERYNNYAPFSDEDISTMKEVNVTLDGDKMSYS